MIITRMKSKRSRLIKKADRLILQFYTQGSCLVCGKPAQTCHHYIPKSQSNATRYYPKNLVPICNACHFAHHTKGDPHIQNTIEKIRGQKWVDELNLKRREICKLSVKELEEIINNLED